LRPYEAAVIFDASLEDTIIRETTDQVVEFVRSHGGTTGRVDRWGRRTFAYELRHKTEGYYVFIELSAEPTLVAELDRMLTLSDDVLRHRVIRQPESVVGRHRPAAPAPERQSAPAAAAPAPATAASEPEAEPATEPASAPVPDGGEQPTVSS
jgi:small subunit ribosomal protein S6